MAHRKLLKQLWLAAMISLLTVSVVFTQESAKEDFSKTTKFDEFTLNNIGSEIGCDTGARLDNLAVTLQSNPNLVSEIIVYGAQEASGIILLHFKHYLVESRGIESSRLTLKIGGRYKAEPTAMVQLWVVPSNGESPALETFGSEKPRFTGRFMSDEAWNPFEIEGLGGHGSIGLAVYADLLREQPETKGYIVARSKKGVPAENIQRALKLPVFELEEIYGIGPERVKSFFGGYLKERFDAEDEGIGTGTTVEYWILPADAPLPAKEAKIKAALPATTRLMGQYDEYTFSSNTLSRLILEELAAPLQNRKDAKLYLILRLTQEEASELSSEKRPDFAKIVESLKSDLQTKFGINSERVVIWNLPPRENDWSSQVEVWLVPPGGKLPDTNPPEDEPATEDPPQ